MAGPDWSLRADDDWAIEEAQTDAPGSPYGRGWSQDADRDSDEERPDAVELAEADIDPP